jgi:hypothetical protein
MADLSCCQRRYTTEKGCIIFLYFFLLVILQVVVDGCAGLLVLIAQASWAKGRWLIVVCFDDDDGKLTYVVKSVHPVKPSTQQPTWPAVLLGAELSDVQETQMEKGAREARQVTQ